MDTRISKKVRSSKEYTTFDQDAHKLNPVLVKMGHGNVFAVFGHE